MVSTQQEWVERVWYGESKAYWPLLPLSWLFAGVSRARRFFYDRGWLRSEHVGVPVVVVGNLTAGGAGKTPITVWLTNALQERGLRTGIVSRGYRGNIGRSPVSVTRSSDTQIVGDEPVMMAQRCGCPVAVHPDRRAAARLLVEQGVDVIVADDGLQHYALRRDYEVLVVDGARGFGNGRPLPAGPLREPPSRAGRVQQIVINGPPTAQVAAALPANVPRHEFRLRPAAARRLDGAGEKDLAEFSGHRVHAVAGIGNPQRFFAMLESAGILVEEHPLEDHAALSAGELDFDADETLLMTEKDAVKCRDLSLPNAWFVPVDVSGLNASWVDDIVKLARRNLDRQHA